MATAESGGLPGRRVDDSASVGLELTTLVRAISAPREEPFDVPGRFLEGVGAPEAAAPQLEPSFQPWQDLAACQTLAAVAPHVTSLSRNAITSLGSCKV